MDVLNYKCPNCSAGLSFDSKSQKMLCKYCQSSFTVDELEEKMKAAEKTAEADTSGSHWEEFDPQAYSEEEQNQTKNWSCPSCGAQMVTDSTVGAAVCPYCDNPMVMPEQFQNGIRPDFVIPFKKDKSDAVEALKNNYQKKPLLPKVFKDQNHLEEIKAVYVPFWLFDLDASGQVQYSATRTRFWSDRDFNYTETSFYNVVRGGEMSFQGIPIDGSEKIDNTMMEAVEPYDYSALEPFELSYLSGYMANKYDQEPDELTDRVYERMQQSVRDDLKNTVTGYNTVTTRSENIYAVKKGKVKYGLLPVWFLNTKWNGQTYSFAMNGQTGKLIGDLPVGKDLLVLYWLKIHIPLAVLMFLLLFFGIYGGMYDTSADLLQYILMSVGVAAIPTFCVTMYQVKRMNTNVPQRDADVYAAGGLKLKVARDMFLYRNVTRTPRPKENNQGGGRPPGGRPPGGRPPGERPPGGRRHP